MLTAKMNGRRLQLEFEAEPGEEALAPYLVAPLSARDGRAMSIRYLLASEGLPHEGPSLAEDLVTALGAENYDRADGELHADDQNLLAQAAFYWQTMGGGTALRALLDLDPADKGEQGGVVSRGKALTVLRSRLVPLLHETKRRMESEHRTPAGSTPDTGSRPAGEKSEPEHSERPTQLQPQPPSPPPPSRDDSPTSSD
jgi:hypothetical protein